MSRRVAVAAGAAAAVAAMLAEPAAAQAAAAADELSSAECAGVEVVHGTLREWRWGGNAIPLNAMDVPVTLYLPAASASTLCPGTVPYAACAHSTMVVFSPGFLVDPAAYASYCRALAASGTPAAIYAKPAESATAPMDDLDSARLLRDVMDFCEAQPDVARWAAAATAASAAAAAVGSERQQEQQQRRVPAAPALRFLLAGHSRGAKTAVLAAAADVSAGCARVVSLAMLDPADGSYDAVESARFPSCLPSLAELASPPALPGAASPAAADGASDAADGAGSRAGSAALSQPQSQRPGPMPVLIVGFGHNGDCIPRRVNYSAFFRAASGGRGSGGDAVGDCIAALVVLRQVGHFQLLDERTFLQESACSAGRVDEAALRALCAGLLVDWVALSRNAAQQRAGVAQALLALRLQRNGASLEASLALAPT
ncbi:hypothetical protein FOA52_011485 [Chlamydomonas sp. UWO 241]|nr:hypothetical protein FOA52_011485 [Chlamydomonas sp. UWO 241]